MISSVKKTIFSNVRMFQTLLDRKAGCVTGKQIMGSFSAWIILLYSVYVILVHWENSKLFSSDYVLWDYSGFKWFSRTFRRKVGFGFGRKSRIGVGSQFFERSEIRELRKIIFAISHKILWPAFRHENIDQLSQNFTMFLRFVWNCASLLLVRIGRVCLEGIWRSMGGCKFAHHYLCVVRYSVQQPIN